MAFQNSKSSADRGASARQYKTFTDNRPFNGYGLKADKRAGTTAHTLAVAHTLKALSLSPHLATDLCPRCLARHLPLPCPDVRDHSRVIADAQALCVADGIACARCETFHAPHPCPLAPK